jgi:hypothetical protein
MKFLTNECEIRVINGEVIVDYRNEREVTITTNSGVSRQPLSRVIPGMSNNWWTANWNGADWNLDLDCGAQRFNGVTTTKRVKEALVVAGLSAADIKAVVSAAKKHKHAYAGRH